MNKKKVFVLLLVALMFTSVVSLAVETSFSRTIRQSVNVFNLQTLTLRAENIPAWIFSATADVTYSSGHVTGASFVRYSAATSFAGRSLNINPPSFSTLLQPQPNGSNKLTMSVLFPDVSGDVSVSASKQNASTPYHRYQFSDTTSSVPLGIITFAKVIVK